MTRSLVPFPNNSSTAAIAEVYTSTGFNAGDYVYYNGATGNYGNQASFTATTATFNPPIQNPIAVNGVLGTNIQNANPTGIGSGGGQKNCAALLTNGNIVQVYMKQSNGYPTFQIVDNTQVTVVVAATTISSVIINTGSSNISVVALTGGGFVVYWLNNTGGTLNYPCFAIYTNTGTVTLAAAQDTAAGVASVASQYALLGVAMANGGFSLAYADSTTTGIKFRGYSSAGVAAYAWGTAAGFNALPTYGFGLTANSFNNIIIAGRTATNKVLQYAMYNFSGTAVVALTSFTSTNSGASLLYCVDLTTLADGNTVVLAYNGIDSSGSYTQAYFSICTTTATTITTGTELYIPYANTISSSGMYVGNNLTVMPLLSGGFILVCLSAGGTYYQNMYAAFNSAGVCTSGLGSGGLSTNAGMHVIGQQIATAASYKVGIVEISSLNIAYIYLRGDPVQLSYSQYCAKLNTTLLNLSYSAQITQPLASAVNSVGAIGLSGTYPTGATFASAVNGGNRVTFTPGTTVVPPTLVYAQSTYSTYGLSITTFPNGNFAIGYMITAQQLLISVYTAAGVFIQTISTGFTVTTASNNLSNFKICALSSGKLAVVWQAASNLQTALFSSSFVQIGTNQTCVNSASNRAANGIGLSALSNDRYVVAYGQTTATTIAVNVYDNTGTAAVYTDSSIVGTGTSTNIIVGGTSDGAFFVSYVDSGGPTHQYYVYTNTTANTFTISSIQGGATGVTTYPGSTSMGTTITGKGYVVNLLSSVYYSYYMGKDGSYGTAGNTGLSLVNYANLNTRQSSSMTTTGYGTPVLAIAKTNTNTISLYGLIGGLVGQNNTVVDTAISTFASSMVTASSGIGYNIVVAYLNASSYPSFVILNAAPLLASEWVPLTTSTVSLPVPIYPVPTAITPAISNTILAGIAVTTAAAGSTGQIQTNGLAQLNSSYSATNIGAFDTTGLPVAGVKGTVNGRNVNMQGNT